jgi:uncharacterized membrane protein
MNRRGLMLFGDPAHPALVHIPLAALVVLPLWDILGFIRDEPVWWSIGFWTLAAGLVVALAAAVAGFTDYVTLEQGHPAQQKATRHMILMITGVSIGVVRLILQGGPAVPDSPLWLVAASVAAAAVITVGARLGGQLVFRHGVGRSYSDSP